MSRAHPPNERPAGHNAPSAGIVLVVSNRSSRTATVGTPAPPMSLAKADGSVWTLNDARTKGPVGLVFLRGFF
jgi:hypothetical protein